MAQRFVDTYRQNGGAIQFLTFDDAPQGFMRLSATSPEREAAREQAVARLVGFILKQAQVENK